MKEKILRVWLQAQGGSFHPVSRRILTTAQALGSGYAVQAVVFSGEALDRAMLESTAVDQVVNLVGLKGFQPELQARFLAGMEAAEILLFPATPEGRTLSGMTAALLHTGSTADCTTLGFTETGCLLQTRPAFSGSRMADILTETRPQIASLRFGMPMPDTEKKPELRVVTLEDRPLYPVRWIEETRAVRGEEKIALAVGGGLQSEEQLDLFRSLAQKLGVPLFCSRALVDRGWMGRPAQIGLSGRTLSADLLVCFGISGSLQFQAGLDRIGKLWAVDINPDTPLMALADVPLQGNLLEIAGAMLRRL